MKNQQNKYGNWVIEGADGAEPHDALFRLADELFMPRGEVCLLTSEGSIGKSLLVMHLSIAFTMPEMEGFMCPRGSAGEPLKACSSHAPKIVLLYADEKEESLRYRLYSLMVNQLRKTPDSELVDKMAGRLLRASMRSTYIDQDREISIYEPSESRGAVDAERRFDDLYEMLSGLGHIDLIVFDPLAPFGGGYFERNGDEAFRMVRQFERLTSLAGNPSVLLVDNSSDPTPALCDAVRWIGSLAHRDEDERGRSELELKVTKSNYGPSGLSVRYLTNGLDIEPIKYEALVLKRLRQMIVLSIEEHGEEMHGHSVELLRHIERTLEEVEKAQGDADAR